MRYILATVLVALIALALAACGGVSESAGAAVAAATTPPAVESGAAQASPTPAAAEATAAGPALSLDVLGNATYGGLFDAPVTLTDGAYEGEPFVEGGASRPTVRLLSEPLVYGDLDGDGMDDAAVLLAADSGGSGTFVYLAAVTAREGAPATVATTLMGDRVQVQSLAVADGVIQVELLAHGPDDPQCCPTRQERRRYRLDGAELVAVE